MAEVGLVRFAGVALEVAKAVLPERRSKLGERLFTQPQLLAVLCPMRYDGGTFREAEVRLREHAELRGALELGSVPDFTTLYRFLRRLREEDLERALREAARRAPVSEPKATVAVGATGLAAGSVGPYFVRRAAMSEASPWAHWTKWLVAVDVGRRLVLAQLAKRGPTNDSATFRPLVSKAAESARVGLVLADAESPGSERSHLHARVLGADCATPAKRGKPEWKVQGHRKRVREDFPAEAYGQRALVESAFSAVERKLSPKAPGRSLATQTTQALLLGLACDLYRLRPYPP